MSNFLAGIIEDKKRRLARERSRVSFERSREKAFDVRSDAASHALRASLEKGGDCNVIAEFKRASPSKGVIRAGGEPAEIARAYAAGGAAAISVLTEEDHFRGSLDDLRAVRAAVSLPVLRKDFLFDEFQIYEAAGAGADALLLIVAALDDALLRKLLRLTEDELGMDALVEVHSADEMRRATEAGAGLVGVNNRDLHTFHVSLDVSLELSSHAPSGALLVSESGLHDGSDIRRLRRAGYSGFLIGETLMRAASPREKLRELLEDARKDETHSQD